VAQHENKQHRATFRLELELKQSPTRTADKDCRSDEVARWSTLG